MPSACPHCGVATSPGVQFCEQCGQPVAARTGSPALLYTALGLSAVGLVVLLLAGPLIYRRLTALPAPAPTTSAASPVQPAPPTPAAPAAAAPPPAAQPVPPANDQALVEALVKDKATLRPDYVGVELAGDWAFADVAEKDADGNWATSTSLLVRKVNGAWQVVAEGDAEVFRHKVPAEVLPALDRWDAGHY